MPTSSIVLLTAGETATTLLPDTAQEISTTWRHETLFPEGVILHRMMHLSREMTDEIGVTPYLSRDRVETVSLSLLMDGRLRNGNPTGGGTLFPNFHEIPRILDTQLFYGNLLMILTIDGSTILPLTRYQYDCILNHHVNHSMDNAVFGTTPGTSSSEPMSISSGDDYDDIESMDISLESFSPDGFTTPSPAEYLNITLNPQRMRNRPVRPVF